MVAFTCVSAVAWVALLRIRIFIAQSAVWAALLININQLMNINQLININQHLPDSSP